MGQRLNIEIWNAGKAQACAYYHWSAYTDAAAQITSDILKFLKDAPEEPDQRLLAVRALEASGAGLTDPELEFIKKSIPEWADKDFAPCIDRNAGLLSVSEEGLADTRYWAEGRVRIYLDESRVEFHVFDETDARDWEKDQKEYEDNPLKVEDLPEYDENPSNIKFDDFDRVRKLLFNGESDPLRISTLPGKVIDRIQ